jgi:hypothetical protein
MTLLELKTGHSTQLQEINTMKPKLTRAQLRAIATATGAQWEGGCLCAADWLTVFEAASFEGFDVADCLSKINTQLPYAEPVELIPLEEQQAICDEIDRHIPGGNHRAWFENQRKLVQAALTKVE